MIRCIAIDDEPKALSIIERYCEKIGSVSLISTFREPLKAMDYLAQNQIDLIFLDINMPQINGFKLLTALPDPPMVIFTTAYNEYAVDSYNMRAIDYLLKPIVFERFLVSVNKAIELFNLKNKVQVPSDEYVLLKSGPKTYKVKINEILYIEKEGNYLIVFTPEQRILIRKNITDVFDIVPRSEFIRVHKSFVAAIKHISAFEAHQLTIATFKIPVSSSYREELKQRLELNR